MEIKIYRDNYRDKYNYYLIWDDIFWWQMRFNLKLMIEIAYKELQEM